jgi:hypothetical protein
VCDERRICTNCETDEAIDECEYCAWCLEDIWELQQPVIEARKAQRDFQEWKDVRDVSKY